MDKINIEEKLRQVQNYWHPHLLGLLNGQEILLSKMKGEFVFHRHDDTDEFFLVIEGSFEMHFRESFVEVKKGECILVPAGVEHKPVAESEAHVLLIHLYSTRNTGNVTNELTRESAPRI